MTDTIEKQRIDKGAGEARSKAIFRHLLTYVPSRYLAQVFQLATALFVRNVLGPFYTGVWSTLRIVISYASYSSLGMMNAIFFKIPLLNGEGKKDKAIQLQNIVFTFLMGGALAISLGVVVYAIIFRSTLPPFMFVGLLLVAAEIIVQRLYAYHTSLLRAEKDFGILSRTVIIDAVVHLGLVLLFVSRFQLYGLLVVVILLPMINVGYIYTQKKFTYKLQLDRKELVENLRFCFPLFIRKSLINILNSIDRIMVVSFFGFHALGLFSIAFMTRNYSEGLYRNFSHVISPYFLEEFGETGDLKGVSKYVVKPTLIMAYVMAGLLGGVFIFSDPLIYYVLPKFTQGLPAMRIYLLATFFSVLSTQATVFITARNKQVHLIPIALVSIILNITLNIGFIRAGFGLMGIATATSITTGLAFLYTYAYAMKNVESFGKIVMLLIDVLLPLLVVTGALMLFDHFIQIPNLFVESCAQLVLLAAIFAPLLWLLNKKTNIGRFAWQYLKEKKKNKT